MKRDQGSSKLATTAVASKPSFQAKITSATRCIPTEYNLIRLNPGKKIKPLLPNLCFLRSLLLNPPQSAFICVHLRLKSLPSKINTMVNSQQGQSLNPYKKKHSCHREKFFFVQNLHDFDETLSLDLALAPPLLKRRPNAGNRISCHRTRATI